ncbi:gp141 [Bacillus phage G]|uniref:Gp141 n=1 Tax=Bacillus phage G TaxID=2884420 RepID=G3MBK7_9CAUD|nr:gp141 [Bacillus phage G]AEO93403.1 gp141 [Bacillus phage G]
MKRLKKKAWETIELYHHTSSQFFMQVMEEGQLTSGGYNGNISGGGHTSIFDVFSDEDPSSNIYYPLIILDEMIKVPSDDKKVTKTLTDLVNKMKEENPDWQSEEIEVSETKPSGNEIGVYLSSDKYNSVGYAEDAVSKGDTSKLNFEVTLAIKVQTDALSPDYDDLVSLELDIDDRSSVPLWKQSLNQVEQCVHNGPIDSESIVSVTFHSLENAYNDSDGKFNDEDEFTEFVSQYIKEDEPMSTMEALSQLALMDSEYANTESLVMSSKKIKRLKKFNK